MGKRGPKPRGQGPHPEPTLRGRPEHPTADKTKQIADKLTGKPKRRAKAKPHRGLTLGEVATMWRRAMRELDDGEVCARDGAVQVARARAALIVAAKELLPQREPETVAGEGVQVKISFDVQSPHVEIAPSSVPAPDASGDPMVIG